MITIIYEKIWTYVQGITPLTLRLYLPDNDSYGTLEGTNLFASVESFQGVSISTTEMPLSEGSIPSVDKVWHLRSSQLPAGIRIPLLSRLIETNGTIWQINDVKPQTFNTRIRCSCNRVGK